MKARNLSIVFLLIASSAAAKMDLQTLHTATGLAQIMARASKCGYLVDEKALAAYYGEKGLADPEVLAWISHKITIESGDLSSLTASECSITEATGRKIGIVH